MVLPRPLDIVATSNGQMAGPVCWFWYLACCQLMRVPTLRIALSMLLAGGCQNKESLGPISQKTQALEQHNP